ncbi:MAG: Ada metal-binding domain-containing protein, partial [Dokdonella sp.]
MSNLVANQTPDPAVCERARLARDPRFDGLFFTAVKTTGIYCRSICPAPTASARNVLYFSHPSAAAAAGFRPCLRCRPERAPGASVHRARSELVRGALRLIDEGVLDRASVAALAARVGVGERHLRRVFADEMGASPLDFAATRRLLFAKQLLSETALPITSVGSAAGYASLRRFNAAFVDSYGKPPREFRRAADRMTANATLTLRLPYRAPYDFDAMLAFLARRAIPGVEYVTDVAYRRTVRVEGESSWFEVARIAGDD